MTVVLVPALNTRFLAYGPRASTTRLAGSVKKQDDPPTSASKVAKAPNPLSRCLDYLATLTVPHTYFTSFYFLSATLSLIWLTQILSRGPGFRLVASHLSAQHLEEQSSMTFRQVLLVWLLMFAQGSRRLWECLTLPKGSSRMWVGHWVLGLGFYAATSVGTWVEGVRRWTCSGRSGRDWVLMIITAAIWKHTFDVKDLTIFPGPDIRTFIGVLLFLLASGGQHDCHVYLASLKTSSSSAEHADALTRPGSSYKLPTHPAFQHLIAPHYTAEILIYFSLALLAVPRGCWMNWTLVCAWVFVAVNLGVTAEGTRRWYERRFGGELVRGRWTLVPRVW